jgi:hypothetical protein
MNEDDWLIVGDPVWEKGVPIGTSLNQVNSGNAAYATNLSGNHPDKSTSSLVSPCYDLSQLESGTIGFYLAYELETYYDFIYFQYSIDNGQSWSTIEAYNGFDSELKEYTYDLNQSMFSENITFRFHMISDTYENEEGAVIDDFSINGTLSTIDNDFIPSMTIYPNPTNGLFTIDTNGQLGLKEIKIFSLESKLIYDAKVFNKSMYEVDFNPPKGIYFIELSTSDQRKIINKLIVE